MIERSLHEAAQDLMDEYADLLDADRLEDWLELFTEDCIYEILSRENVEQGMVIPLMLCKGKNMLRDRIVAVRKALKYNFHYDRHVVSNVRVRTAADGAITMVASYAVFQSTHEGRTHVFSVGRYADRLRMEDGKLKFVEKRAITDTFAVPNLIATPI